MDIRKPIKQLSSLFSIGLKSHNKNFPVRVISTLLFFGEECYLHYFFLFINGLDQSLTENVNIVLHEGDTTICITASSADELQNKS